MAGRTGLRPRSWWVALLGGLLVPLDPLLGVVLIVVGFRRRRPPPAVRLVRKE